jgi:hypothetical protein
MRGSNPLRSIPTFGGYSATPEAGDTPATPPESGISGGGPPPEIFDLAVCTIAGSFLSFVVFLSG